LRFSGKSNKGTVSFQKTLYLKVIKLYRFEKSETLFGFFDLQTKPSFGFLPSLAASQLMLGQVEKNDLLVVLIGSIQNQSLF
jgi:hypothetical protein